MNKIEYCPEQPYDGYHPGTEWTTTTCASIPSSSIESYPPLKWWERLWYRIQDAFVPIEVWLHRHHIIESDWVDWKPCKDCRDLGEATPADGFLEPK